MELSAWQAYDETLERVERVDFMEWRLQLDSREWERLYIYIYICTVLFLGEEIPEVIGIEEATIFRFDGDDVDVFLGCISWN